MKRAKDKEYYQRKKAEKKTKSISEMSEREKRQQRKLWKKIHRNIGRKEGCWQT